MGLFDFVGKGIKAITGVDVNAGPGNAILGKTRTAQTGDSSNYDYGGSPEYANQFRDYLQGRAYAAGREGAPQLNRAAVDEAMSGFRYGAAGQRAALADEAQAREQQAQALGMYRDAAMGKGESVAAAQQRQGLEESSRLGQNMAANAVGANPLLAASNAASASADAARRSTAGAAALRAQEIADARSGYAGLSGAMRQGDLARGDAYLAGGNAALGAGQFGFGAEQAQAGLEMQQRQMSSQERQAYDQFMLQMNRDALAGRVGYGNSQAQVSMANAGNSVQTRGQNQEFANNIFKGVGGAMGLGGG